MEELEGEGEEARRGEERKGRKGEVWRGRDRDGDTLGNFVDFSRWLKN